MPPVKSKKQKPNGAGELGFEATLWAAADKLRGNMDAAEYKHIVLGLIFLKYISDVFEEKHAALQKETGADPEDRDEYLAENVFWVPPEARWSYLQGRAKDPLIGKLLDNAMIAIERDNPSLKNTLPKDYSRPHLDKQSLGGVMDLMSTLALGSAESRAKDILGRVYEYFLSRFASAEGKKGGQFYTPRCVVQLLVEMLAPWKGRVFDPCCGSGGMFIQSIEFVKAHATGNGNGGKAKGDLSIFGQESNPTTWRLAKMNLAIRGIEGDLGEEPADSFHRDLHKALKADYILASRARRRLRHGDTVLSTVRPERGSYFLCLNPSPNLIASTGFAVVTPTKAPWSFIHAALTHPEVSEHLGQHADGGAYPAVRPEIIGKWEIPWPANPERVERFHRACAPLYERAEHNRRESRSLAALRDALLPKLLSGEVWVTELTGRRR